MSILTTGTVGFGLYEPSNEDLHKLQVIKSDGRQNFLLTLDRYIQMLKEDINTLEIIKDSTDDKEAENMELVMSDGLLTVVGDANVISRYVECGVVEFDDGSSNSDSDYYNCYGNGSEDSDTENNDTENNEFDYVESTSSSESSTDYNEYCNSDNSQSDDIEPAPTTPTTPTTPTAVQKKCKKSFNISDSSESSESDLSDSSNEILVKKNKKNP